ncbi:DPP IV N-terminal domain-containing protein [Nocardioides sp. L-11A]|uniref:S9 family peptidase n=1 Tax=Nocardioides sp. L-11A TaxID=3043848 RepID=UPI00249CDCE3|nr:DPP IV N-terminal domain-containing protein [Nocardioides sp. L-11A]
MTRTPPEVSAEDYARAAKVLDSSLADAVLNGHVTARWLDSNRFWYERDGADGPELAVVDIAQRHRAAPLDGARLAEALRGSPAAAAVRNGTARVEQVEEIGDALLVTLTTPDGSRVRSDLSDYESTSMPAPAPSAAITAPSGEHAAFVREADLWLRRPGDGDERALTSDGERHFAYGKLPDHSQSVLMRAAETPMPPVGVEWAPDSKHLFGTRWDERAVPIYPYVESVPRDGTFRPKLHPLRLALLGDPDQPQQEIFSIDASTGEKRTIDIGRGWTMDTTSLGWSADARTTYRIAHTEGWRSMALVEIDVAAGTSRRVIEEAAATSSVLPHTILFSPPNVRVLQESGEVVWFSERDGWGHLYLYDLASGALKRQLTHGDWLVRDLIEVDGRRRRVFFTACGREEGRDPYYRHLYRVSLDGSDPLLLTPEDAEHEIPSPLPTLLPAAPGRQAFSPDRDYFIDTYSTVSEPPVSVVRSSEDGSVVMRLETADASAAYAAGWRPPTRVHAKGADGETDVYAVVYFPTDFDGTSEYPVIDATYGGPWTLNAPRSFVDALSTFNPVSRASLAALGFVVVTIDARGTRGRSRAFTNVGYGNFVDPGLADHVAVIQQIAARHGGLDLDRVGIYGHSFGGYVSARAMLSRPEFFKVCVSSAGPHNYQGFYAMEHLLGLPAYGDGRVRPSPQSVPDNYRALDNAPLAARLRGRLMLAYGDLDESAMPAVTLQLADALIGANKSFDLLYLPSRTHDFFRTDFYFIRRMWDYFVEHLLGATPPADFDLVAAIR